MWREPENWLAGPKHNSSLRAIKYFDLRGARQKKGSVQVSSLFYGIYAMCDEENNKGRRKSVYYDNGKEGPGSSTITIVLIRGHRGTMNSFRPLL